MKVILKEDIKGVGKQGDVKEVKRGYAYNYLFPHNLCFEANDDNVKRLEEYKKAGVRKAEKEKDSLKKLAEQLGTLSCNITVQAGEDDKLYGSVTNADIADALKKQGIELDKRKIMLEEPLKQIGIYSVKVHLAPEIEGTLKVWVIKQ